MWNFLTLLSIQCSRAGHIGPAGQPPCKTAFLHPWRPLAATALLCLWESLPTEPASKWSPREPSLIDRLFLWAGEASECNLCTLPCCYLLVSWLPLLWECSANTPETVLTSGVASRVELHMGALILRRLCSVVLNQGSHAPGFLTGAYLPALLRLWPVLSAPRSFLQSTQGQALLKNSCHSLLGEPKVLVIRKNCPGGSEVPLLESSRHSHGEAQSLRCLEWCCLWQKMTFSSLSIVILLFKENSIFIYSLKSSCVHTMYFNLFTPTTSLQSFLGPSSPNEQPPNSISTDHMFMGVVLSAHLTKLTQTSCMYVFYDPDFSLFCFLDRSEIYFSQPAKKGVLLICFHTCLRQHRLLTCLSGPLSFLLSLLVLDLQEHICYTHLWLFSERFSLVCISHTRFKI